jgi:dolichol-phosphate mannosyltransferase
MTSLTIVIPTYNEAENLQGIAEALWDLPSGGLSILVVDDDSPDGTGEIADRLARDNPDRFSVIHRRGKLGLGSAYITGFQAALLSGAEAIGQMDADFSHQPTYIPTFMTALGGSDLVIGSRYVPGGSVDERWGMGRVLLSWWGNFYARSILRMRVNDATGGFRLWRRETLVGMPLNDIRSNGYVFQVEMAYVAARLGYQMTEIPIHFEDRRIGQSKMSFRIQVEAALRVWQVLLMHRHLTPQDRSPLAMVPAEGPNLREES